jgi:hypothetical protein
VFNLPIFPYPLHLFSPVLIFGFALGIGSNQCSPKNIEKKIKIINNNKSKIYNIKHNNFYKIPSHQSALAWGGM